MFIGKPLRFTVAAPVASTLAQPLPAPSPTPFIRKDVARAGT